MSGMTPLTGFVLRALADGRFHSGQELASDLGVSRTAIWKQVQTLVTDLGLEISSVRGRGYRLASPMELLDVERIRAAIDGAALPYIDSLQLLVTTGSTNSEANAALPDVVGRARVWLAEHQSAGRGRRGRSWVSTFGRNLYLSLAWRFDLPMADLAGLSLAAGVALAEVLRESGLERHRLKWPNDLVVDGRKLAGVLVEVSGEAGGPAVATIGVGVNLDVSSIQGMAIDQPWIDLASCRPGAIQRNQFAGRCINGLVHACELFSRQRLAPFLPRWEAFDSLFGLPVSLTNGTRVIEGVYRGVTATGSLLLEDGRGLSEHNAGEVSVRAAVGLR